MDRAVWVRGMLGFLLVVKPNGLGGQYILAERIILNEIILSGRTIRQHIALQGGMTCAKFCVKDFGLP
jgi:hypothetical protein